MLNPGEHPVAVVATLDQWVRATHRGTTVVDGCVQLGWQDTVPAATTPPAPRRGLAFDARCHLWRTDGAGLWRHRWEPGGPAGPVRFDGEPLVAAAAAQPVVGGFHPDPAPAGAGGAGPAGPSGPVAVTGDGLIHAVASDPHDVVTLDPVDGRPVRRLTFDRPALDVAAQGDVLVVLLDAPAGLVRVAPGAEPVPAEAPGAAGAPAGSRAVAVAVSLQHGVLVLWSTPGGGRIAGAHLALDVPDLAGVTDLAVDGDGALVVAGLPGEAFVALEVTTDATTPGRPRDGFGYDGSGVVVLPDGRIGFWTAGGLRVAYATGGRLRTSGHVTTLRLDGGAPGTRWGRVFVDACLPERTELRVRTATLDTEDWFDGEADLATVPEGPPERVTLGPWFEATAELAPPRLPLVLEQRWVATDAQRLHRRSGGRELPPTAVTTQDDGFATYESVVVDAPGRFLWLRIELRGSGRVTPRVRALRVERPGHDLLRRLPRAWSRHDEAAAFLQRYLAPLDGEIAGWAARAAQRWVLVDPRTTPEDALAWLAGFVGLTLDERIPLGRRRLLVAEAAQLFARRGTVGSLTRLLELVIGVRPVIVERFRLRGLGGALLDDASTDAASWPVIGGGFRVGGATAREGDDPASGPVPSEDAFATHAHRFSVVVPGILDADRAGALHDLLDTHRPAHTVVDVCSVDAGLRVGVGLHLGLSSVVGPTGAFEPIVVGDALLGRDGVLGEARRGIRPGGAVVGDVRLGWGG